MAEYTRQRGRRAARAAAEQAEEQLLMEQEQLSEEQEQLLMEQSACITSWVGCAAVSRTWTAPLWSFHGVTSVATEPFRPQRFLLRHGTLELYGNSLINTFYKMFKNNVCMPSNIEINSTLNSSTWCRSLNLTSFLHLRPWNARNALLPPQLRMTVDSFDLFS